MYLGWPLLAPDFGSGAEELKMDPMAQMPSDD